MTTRHPMFIGVLLFMMASCGGLKYQINDALVADVPVAEKQGVLEMQDEQAWLKQQRSLARSEHNIAERDLSVARAEYGIAKLGVDQVQADLELAKSTTDLNRIGRAKARLAVAELGRSAADTKLALRKMQVQHAAQTVRVVEAQQQQAATRYEQEKARLAASKGKVPYEKFSLIQFDAQVSEAQAKLDKERVEEDKLRQEIAQIEGRYQVEKQHFEAARRSAPTQAIPPASLLARPSQYDPAQPGAMPPL